MSRKVVRALVSVSDKTGVVNFARGLADRGIEVVSTGGTARALAEADVPVTGISDVTDFPEILDGRVKTLHPKVHGGILANRDLPAHEEALGEHGITPIGIVCVNLYPFEEALAKGVSDADQVEEIDIGGPCMVRAAAKNCAHVAVVTEPDDYGRLLSSLDENDGAVADGLRFELAAKAFARTAEYDVAVAGWMGRADGESSFPGRLSISATKVADLRYGENPHQSAALFETEPGGLASAEPISGKAISYNNMLDLEGARGLLADLDGAACCVLKHSNPCGCAQGDTLREAVELAWEGDPLSAFGSIVGLTQPVDAATAEFLTEDNRFVECVLAPTFEDEALEILTTRPKWGKSVRLVALADMQAGGWEIRRIGGGLLVQDRDLSLETDFEWVTERQGSDEDLEALRFGWLVAKHTKSNAIVMTQGTQLVGVGAGQMSRVDSVHLAARKAGDRAQGAALASDAFFPFPDGVEAAVEAGARVIVQPGGSVRDEAVIARADELDVAMAFTGHRHFRH